MFVIALFSSTRALSIVRRVSASKAAISRSRISILSIAVNVIILVKLSSLSEMLLPKPRTVIIPVGCVPREVYKKLNFAATGILILHTVDTPPS